MKRLILFIILIYFSGDIALSQFHKPADWNDMIAAPWYFGNISNKPAFAYLDPENPSTAYFFVANKALPEVFTVTLKWKRGDPYSASFMKGGYKIKAKFIGSAGKDTIAGYLKTSRKNAIRLGISPRVTVFMTKEILCPQAPMPPSPQASTPPCAPASMPPRYLSPIFNSVDQKTEISYGAATGYYISMPVETEGYDYEEIILDAMRKMYLNPTKEAILHLLNKDPVAFALTDMQPLRLDIYEPSGDTQTERPLIMLLHGGAFILGDKATESIRELATDFARKGYVVASINYRIGFNPASKSSLERAAYRAVQDARAALRYLSANAAAYRIDPRYVFLGGSSAGAITALNTAFMKEEERPESTGRNIWRAQIDLGKLDESTNTVTGEYTIRALVNLWGAVNDTNIIDSYERIPVLSVHGDADKIVPYNYSYPFLDLDTGLTANIVSKLYGSFPIDRRLKDLGIYSELITLHDAGHEPQYEPGRYRMVMDTIQAYATEFYFRALLNFPEVTGPRQIAIGTSPSTYSIPLQNDLSYYWQIKGGKIIPGPAKNTARVVWLAESEGVVSLVLIHKNGANAELKVPVKLP